MSIEYRVTSSQDEYDKDRPKLSIHETEHIELIGKFMLNLIERWGMVAGDEDGEDSTGRQKSRLMTPEELVDRAYLTAILTFEKMRTKGFIKIFPTIDQMREQMNEIRIKEKEETVEA